MKCSFIFGLLFNDFIWQVEPIGTDFKAHNNQNVGSMKYDRAIHCYLIVLSLLAEEGEGGGWGGRGGGGGDLR